MWGPCLLASEILHPGQWLSIVFWYLICLRVPHLESRNYECSNKTTGLKNQKDG
jgi:hypothetical protein